jgi:hypothetical protein
MMTVMQRFRLKVKTMTLVVLAIVSSLITSCPAPLEAASGRTYAGLEYYGSSQMTRAEVEKSLHLRPGSSENSVETNAENFRKKLEKMRLSANVQIVNVAPDKLYVVVDFEDALGAGIPVRVLKNPHHVKTKSEKPALLLEKLRSRIDRLNEEGREWTDSYPGGVRMFSDEPASQIVVEIRRFGPVMRDEWLEVVACDPDKRLRCDAIELLNWAPQPINTCAELIPAIDDSHYEVRASAAEFIFPRLEILPDDFPFDKLAMALVRQMKRHSHGDRIKSIAFITALVRIYPAMAVPFRRLCEEDLERFSKESQIPTLRQSADNLLVILRAPLPKGAPVEIPQAGF